MSISTPPAPAKKKKPGCGCFGCGCLLVVLLILSTGLVAGFSYLGYTGLDHILTTTPADVPAVDDSDTAYNTVQQKLASVQDQLKNHQPTTITLTAADINSLIAHNPALTQNNVHAFFSLKDDQARLQASVPTDVLTRGAVKGRYFNMDISFNLSYDTTGKSVNMTPVALKVGDQVLMGPGVKTSSAASFDQAVMTWMVNFGLRQNAQVAALLDETKSIAIKSGQLVIETK